MIRDSWAISLSAIIFEHDSRQARAGRRYCCMFDGGEARVVRRPISECPWDMDDFMARKEGNIS
jgi:hypothetical protein